MFLDLEAFPAVIKSIESRLTAKKNYRPLTASLRILTYFGEAPSHISWHADATGISYDTPIRIHVQEAIPVPDGEEECRSEVVFSSKGQQSGHHEFDKPNDRHKI